MGLARTDETPVVLCVDDDVCVLAAVSRVLRRAGLHVITAAGAASALEHLERGGIDVVISDAHMPGMTGIELLTRFMRERPSVARILLSGSPQRLALESGVAELLLSKPTPHRELVEAVMRLWQNKRPGSINRAS